MTYREDERNREVPDPAAVLHPMVEATALEYFRRRSITWWGGRGPTPSPISSQVACINHLEPARVDGDLAHAILRAIDPGVTAARKVEDDGFAAFEYIGAENYLGERRWGTRGEKCTSIDAIFVLQREERNLLVLLEWKYTESYKAGQSKLEADETRLETYRPLLEAEGCPIQPPDGDLSALFYEPIYQLMRQTLLAWRMARACEFEADDWLHVHVIPEGNRALRDVNPSPGLEGSTLADAWRSVLVEPSRYVVLTPPDLMRFIAAEGAWRDWREWLRERYGS
jgi:hypothetical protein